MALCPRGRALGSGLVTFFWMEEGGQGQEWSTGPWEAQTLQAEWTNTATIHIFYCHGMEAKETKESSRKLAAVGRPSAHRTTAFIFYTQKKHKIVSTAAFSELEVASVG